jgi:uncharacterized protein (TIRG00374 family)
LSFTALRVFSSSPTSPRLRRPTDVLFLILAVLLTGAMAIVAPGPTSLDESLTTLIQSLPGLSGWLWELAYLLLSVWSVALVLIVLLARARRRLLWDITMAAALSLGAALLAGWVSGTDWSTSIGAITRTQPPAVYVAVLLAVATAIVVVMSPHLSRPLRNVGRGILLLGSVAGISLGVALPIGIVAGFAVGVAAAAATHLLRGSPDGRLTPAQVASALADLGLVCDDVREAPSQTTGVAVLDASGEGGRRLTVKVYGRDTWDGQFLASVWNSLWRKGETPSLTRGRLELVEHEAVATLLAERGGVAVLPVVVVGLSADGDGLLATDAAARPLADLAPDEVTDGVLADAWRALLRLHDVGIAHGRIDAQHVVIRQDGSVALSDLAGAELSGSEVSLQSDRARMLVATALAATHEKAMEVANQALGPDRVAGMLPYLQPAVLDRSTRTAVGDGDWDLASLRAQVVELTGVEPPPLQRLRRVSLRHVLYVVGGALLAYYFISKLAGVDFASLWAELKSADPSWLLAALLVSPLVQVAFSFSTLGASITPVRYGPVLLLQYAIQFIAVVLPATAARLALEIRFFERFGIAAAGALSIGVIDSVSGFVVQVLLLLLIVLSPAPGLTEPLTGSSDSTSSSSSGSTISLAALAAIILVVGLVVAIALPRTRRRLREAVPRIRATLRGQAGAARTALGVVRHPRKVSEMLAGNLAAQLLQALVLGLCLAAFGAHAHFSQLILINTLVSLFAGLMPVPGGVGVAEAGITAGLQAIGIPSSVAISTAIAFRLVTFYLPPLWGWAAMRWLRKHSYV